MFTGQEFSSSLLLSLQLFSPLPVSQVIFASFPPSCHPLCLLPPSLYPSLLSILLSSVQLHSNPGRQQDLELTGEMRWWNEMTSVVQVCVCVCLMRVHKCVFVPRASHLALIKCVCAYDYTYCCVSVCVHVFVCVGAKRIAGSRR